MNFSVVIALYNERDNLAPVVEEVEAVLGASGALAEVVLVDDGSDDGSAQAMAELARRFPRLVCVSHDRRCGKSRAVLTGARVATADWLLLMDGDGQNDPRDAASLFALLAGDSAEADLGMVAGLRRRRRDSHWKRLGSRIGNGVRRLLLKDGCSDTGCGLKLVRRQAFLEMPFFDGQHRFMSALLQAQGWRVAYGSVDDRPRLHGQSKVTNLGRAFRGLFDLMGVFWLTRRARNPVVHRVADKRSPDRGAG